MRSPTLTTVTIIKKTESGPELRRAERFDTRQSLWFEGQDRRMAAEARNMSATGMFVLSEHPQAIGSQVKVSFDDPEAGQVSLQMEVVWTDSTPPADGTPTKMGLKVIGFEDGTDAFHNFVTRHLRTEGSDEK